MVEQRIDEGSAVALVVGGSCAGVNHHAIVLNGTLAYQASGNYRQGQWFDLTWTLSYSILILVAGTWNEPELGAEIEKRSRSFELLAQFSPLLIPAVVFPLVLSIAREQFYWSVALATVSFAAAGGRFVVVQRQLMVSSEELEKNLALLRGITESTTDAVFVKNSEGRYVMSNPASARFVGLEVSEVLGKNDQEIFTPETGRPIMERDREILRSGETITYEEVGTAKGITRTFLTTKGPYRDAAGKTIGVLGIARDITDRKRAEEEFRRSQQSLRMHIENTPLAVVEWDLEFRVVSWNPAAEKIFGYSREEAVGNRGSFIVPSQWHSQVDQVWKLLLNQKGGSRSTNNNVTKDGRTIS